MPVETLVQWLFQLGWIALSVPISALWWMIHRHKDEHRQELEKHRQSLLALDDKAKMEADRLHARVNDVRQDTQANHLTIVENFATKTELYQQLDDVKTQIREGRDENNAHSRQLQVDSEKRHESIMSELRRLVDKMEGKADKK